MKKASALLALLLVSCMLLAACGGGGGTTSTAGGASTAGSTSTANGGNAPANNDSAITIAQSSEVANLNPALFPRTPDQNVQNMIYDPLVGPLEDLSFEGVLAESWEISDDGTVYTFKLREGITWHDGTPFTANDVVFTFNALAHPDYVGGAESRVSSIVGSDEVKAGEAETISGLEAADDHTVKFTLKTPDASFLGQLYFHILPQHLLGDINPGEWERADFNRAPVGTGKYKFVKWESGQYIEMERYDDYYGKKPSIKTVYYRFGDTTTMTTALMNGEVDIVETIPASEIDTLNSSNIASAYTYTQMTMYYVGLNQQNEFLSDIRVRQALSHALDKVKLVDTVYGDIATATDDLFPLNHWSHNADVTVYEYNPEKAEQLLQDAGFEKNASGIYEKDGKPLKFTYDMVKKAAEEDSMAQLIQQAWKAIGVDMEIRQQDFSTLAFTRLLPSDSAGVAREVTADDFDMYILGFGVEVDPDEYRTYFVTEFAPPNGMNFINYSNTEVDALFAESITQTNQEEREEIYHKISKIFSDDIPWIPLYNNVQVVGLGEKVQNFVADYRGLTYQIAEWNMA